MKQVFLITISIFALVACKKEKNDGTITKVGFYYEDVNIVEGEKPNTYNLYIDDVFKGKINILKEEPSNQSLLYFETLDSKRHEIDVKDNNGKYLSSSYIHVQKSKMGSGSGKNNKKVDGVNASKFTINPASEYAIFAAYK